MTEIQNSKHGHDIEEQKCLFGLGHWILEFICNLLARRLSGGVLVI